MATDGVKIIDGDTAHDTYWGIMDLYDSGADFKTINKEFPLNQTDYFDEFDNEIYVTSNALALWELGKLTNQKLSFVKKIIAKGACVKEWAENNEKDSKARQKVLDRFINKISQPNLKIRARKKYRKISNLYFQQDDLISFKLKDGNYRAVVCCTIEQRRGQCNYLLVPTTYNSSTKPTAENLKNYELLGREIGSGYNQTTTLDMQEGIEKIWKLKGGNCNFFFGITQIAVDHKDFINFKVEFEKVGTLKIIKGLKKTGSFGYAEEYERFEEIFGDLENHIKIFGYNKYPVRILCSE